MSRHIPEAIKREVRKRCGFTCVLCGNLIWEYEHIVPFAECKEHCADNITLLCKAHHGEVTAGRLDKAIVKRADQNPFGRRNSFYSSHALHLNQLKWIHALDHVVSIKDPNCKVSVIKRRDEDCFSITLEDGWPFISLTLRDYSGDIILSIFENEIMFCSHKLQDINFVGKNLTVKNLKNEIIFRLTLDQSVVSVTYAEFIFEDMVIVGTDGGIIVVNSLLAPNGSRNNRIIGFVEKGESVVIFGVDLSDETEKCFMSNEFHNLPTGVSRSEMLKVARASSRQKPAMRLSRNATSSSDYLTQVMRTGLWGPKKNS